MPTVREVAEGFGLQNVGAAIEAAEKADLPVHVAFALLQMESMGRNIFGHDSGGMYPGQAVTKAKFERLEKAVAAGGRANGVGPTQITHRSHLPAARKQGLKLWLPGDNMLYGFRLLVAHYRKGGSWSYAGTRFNGKASYGRTFARRVGEWRKRLEDATWTTVSPASPKTSVTLPKSPRSSESTTTTPSPTTTATTPSTISGVSDVAFATWQGATRCTSGATPGARALMVWILDNAKGARNGGIFNCRNVRGGSTTSLHGEGRALDVMMPMARGRGSAAGHKLVDQLRANAGKLGIQAIIYDRKIWSAKSPGGRAYNGVNPHYDHLHIELNRESSRSLTLARVKDVLGGKVADPARPAITLAHVVAAAKVDPKSDDGKASHGREVKLVEAALKAEALLEPQYASDGLFGSKTVEAYKRWQQRLGYEGKDADGVPGHKSLQELGRRHGFDVK